MVIALVQSLGAGRCDSLLLRSSSRCHCVRLTRQQYRGCCQRGRDTGGLAFAVAKGIQHQLKERLGDTEEVYYTPNLHVSLQYDP